MGRWPQVLLLSALPLAVALGWETPAHVSQDTLLRILPSAVSTPDGGAVVCWGDNRSQRFEVYAQRLRGTDGYLLWNSDGVEVSKPSGDSLFGHRFSPATASAGDGGAIVAWVNQHKLGNYVRGIYVTKLSPVDGHLEWKEPGQTLGGRKVAQDVTTPPALCSDGAGGCIVTAVEGDQKSVKAWRVLSGGDFSSYWGGRDGLTIRAGAGSAVVRKVGIAWDGQNYAWVVWTVKGGGSPDCLVSASVGVLG